MSIANTPSLPGGLDTTYGSSARNSLRPIQSVTTVSCCCPGFPLRRADKHHEDASLSKNNENEPPSYNDKLPLSTSRPIQRASTAGSVTTVYDLPPGWKAIKSRSRPDRNAFLNEFTGERISWIPTEPASQIKGEAKKMKRRNKVNNGTPEEESDEEAGATASVEEKSNR